LIKEACRNTPLDWRLVTSLMYEETRFIHERTSWAGACGLMQLMPSVMQDYGIDSSCGPKQNIQAGVKLLVRLDKFWRDYIPDQNERLKFVLASYNAGLGHVKDAQRLTKKFGKDTLFWNDNVGDYMKLKSKPKYYQDEVVVHGYCRGEGVHNYVTEILSRYDQYKLLIP